MKLGEIWGIFNEICRKMNLKVGKFANFWRKFAEIDVEKFWKFKKLT